MRGVEDAVAALPDDAVATVTASPTRGMEPTMELAAQLVAAGHRAVPHLSARLVASRDHLDELLARMEELGILEAFVIAGDAPQPAGPYPGAVELLEEMSERGHGLTEVGISGYPERHPFLDDQTTITAMAAKAPHATYVVSQICYEPTTIRGWISALRARGVDLPVHVGLPGVIDRRRLLALSLKVGMGDSVRYLSKQGETATRLLTGYTPDELLHGLIDLLGDPAEGIAGWHLFTFNEVARTEAWRRQLLAGLG
jgi:methylenetetrahydrofolate reductase (NADPH)